MNVMDLRVIYDDNKKAIEKLQKALLTEKKENNILIIKENLFKLKREQSVLSSKIRKHMYGNVTRKNISHLMKYTTNKDEDTIKLPVEEVRKVVFKDAKVVFDGKYKIVFNEGRDIFEMDIDEDLLTKNCNSIAIFDFNVVEMLKEFDNLNRTNLYERYMSNDLPVLYDFNMSEKNNTDKKNLKRIKKIVRKEMNEERFKNVKSRDRKSKIAAVATIIGLVGISIFGVNSASRKNTTSVGTKTKVMVESSDILNENTEAQEIVNNIIDKKEEVAQNEVIEKQEIVNNIIDKKEEVAQNEVIEKQELVIDSVEESREEKEIKIGDYLSLDSVGLYYSSRDTKPVGNTENLKYDKYKVGLISVVSEGQIVKLYKDDSKSLEAIEKEAKEAYGEDVKVYVNVDLLDENNEISIQYAGWATSDDVHTKGKVLIK